MDVIVSCPECRLSVPVPEESVLTAVIVCPRCRHTFGPSGPDVPPPEPPPPARSYPKIPAYTPSPAPPRAVRPQRPTRESADRAGPTRSHRGRVWPWVVVVVAFVGVCGLFSVGGVVWWALQRANGEGTWARHSPPDAPEIELEFPATPAVATERVDTVDNRTGKVVSTSQTDPMFKCELANGETYAVLVRPVPWAALRSKERLSPRREAVMALPSLVRGRNGGELRESIPTAGYDSDECFVPNTDGRAHVFRAILLEDRVYTLFVRGPEVSRDAPRVQRFLNSFRHTRIAPGQTAPQPTVRSDPDELRLAARVTPHGSAVFAPKLNAVFVACGEGTLWTPWDTHPRTGKPVKPVQVKQPGASIPHIVRYHYPSFRLEGVMPIKNQFHVLAVDEAAGRVTGAGAWTGHVQGIYRQDIMCVAHDVPQPSDAPIAWFTRAEPVATYPGTGMNVSPERHFSADGARLYMTLRPPFDQYVVRAFDLRATNWAGAVVLPDIRPGASASPDGSRVYALTWKKDPASVGWNIPGSTLHEIDSATMRVRRAVPLRSAVNRVACVGDGRVLAFGGGDDPWGGVEQPLRTVSIDLTVDPPRESLLDAIDHFSQHALRGTRLYTLGGSMTAWDVADVAAGRMTQAAQVTRGQSKGFVVSPDGKCMILDDGRVYWLSGAGPMPEIAPEARWE